MENLRPDTFDLYHDIQQRTGGEIYIGVLGPVRCGKSNFIKRFMDVMVLPYMEDEHAKARALDELPQSAGGKTITTTEPKFIPKEAASIVLEEGVHVKVRLIDCVGYMVEGAVGHMENDQERMVKTPWFQNEIPFTKAAEIGTDKVMNDHSTIGLVITTDGSFGELKREQYIKAEEKTINALKNVHKPFIVLLNSMKPYSQETRILAEELRAKYSVQVLPVNCEQLKKEDINRILENVLYEFPISMIEFYMPKWVEMLPDNHVMKQELIDNALRMKEQYTTVRDCMTNPMVFQSEYIKNTKMDRIIFCDGCIKVALEADDTYYYKMLTEMVGEEIGDEYQLINKLKEFSKMKTEYMGVQQAVNMVRMKGYGVVMPAKEEITLHQPEVIRHGNKYGVKIHAVSPSIHMIKANIETEIAPIVGTQEQAEDLIQYITQSDQNGEGIWDTNIFGKSVEQLINDGITTKIASVGEECQEKLQDTMNKVVNDSNGGMVCIII